MTTEARSPFFPRCLECGGQMELTRREGRTRELVKGVHLPIPADFEIPTCQTCGEEVWSPEMSEVLDTKLNKQLGELIRGYIDEITERFKVTQAQVGSACRVDHTYLSHLTRGRKTPSGTLVELLRIFVDVEGAFEHALRGIKRQPCPVVALDGERIGKLIQLAPRHSPIPESVSAGTFGRPTSTWNVDWSNLEYPAAANGV